jgi:uncharacterized protein YkwD
MSIRRGYVAFTACFLFVLVLHAFAAAAHASVQRARQTNIYLPLIARSQPPPASPTVEQQVVALTNQERHRHGCSVDLVISPKLSASASGHSADMAINNLFSHNGSDGSTPVDRFEQSGYQFSWMAENIAVGYATPADVVGAWMQSSAHRANILNCNLREIGIGFYDQPDDQGNVRDDSGHLSGPYRFYWTQDFGTPR